MMELLEYSYFRNALIGILLVSIVSAMIGTYIVAGRKVFVTGGITHASFGGLGLGYFAGINPILTAMLFAIGAALGVQWMSGRRHVREDSAIAVVWALGMAVGTIFVFMTPGYVPELTAFLFGNILTISITDITIFALFTALLIAVFSVCFRLIEATLFDADFSRTRLLPVRFSEYLMTILTAVCIVLTIRMIGIVLLMSMFTLPQMIAELFSRRLKGIMLLSIGVNIACAIIALRISYILDVPVSATIVLILAAAYGLCRIAKSLLRKA